MRGGCGVEWGWGPWVWCEGSAVASKRAAEGGSRSYFNIFFIIHVNKIIFLIVFRMLRLSI